MKLIGNLNKINKIAVPSYSEIRILDINDILYCEAEGSYTNIYLKNNEKVEVSKHLKRIENLLPNEYFCRVHRSFLVNMNYIRKITNIEKYQVFLNEDCIIDVSYRKKNKFIEKYDEFITYYGSQN